MRTLFPYTTLFRSHLFARLGGCPRDAESPNSWRDSGLLDPSHALAISEGSPGRYVFDPAGR
jgi:hypothetical protein